MPERVLVSTSAGKDSVLALHELLQRDGAYQVEALLTTVTEGRVTMHGLPRELLRRHAASLGHPLIEVEIPRGCTDEEYSERMSAVLLDQRERGVRSVSFGDVHLADLRSWREHELAALGMSGVFPLWRRDPTELAHHFLELGFRATVVCIDPKRVPRALLGRDFDESLLADLPEGVDPAGEAGELHTFVHAGPLLREPVPFERGQVVERDGFLFQELLPAGDPAPPPPPAAPAGAALPSPGNGR